MRKSLIAAAAAAALLAAAGGASAQILTLDGETSPIAQFDAAAWADAAAIVGDLVNPLAPAQQPAGFDLFADGLAESGSPLWVVCSGAAELPPIDGDGFGLLRAYRAAEALQDEPAVADYDVEFNAGVLPEPMSWGMMIIGFFGAGWLLRRHKQTMLAAWPAAA